MKRGMTRREALAAAGFAVGSATIAAAAAPLEASQEPPSRGPVITYTTAGFFDGRAGFPELMVYADGTVLSAKPATYPDGPQSATVHHVTPSRVRRLLTRLREVGLFDVTHPVTGISGHDFTTPLIEAVDGTERVTGLAFGWPKYSRNIARIWRAAGVLDRFRKTLDAGESYQPAGYLLEMTRPPAPEEGEQEPPEWPLKREVSLYVLEGGWHDRITLSPKYLTQLASVGPAYAWHIVKHYDRYAVRWRPLYPHE